MHRPVQCLHPVLPPITKHKDQVTGKTGKDLLLGPRSYSHAPRALPRCGSLCCDLNLLGVVSVPCRVSFLKKAVDQRNKAITSLNEAMNVSCALLSSQEGTRPISCTIATSWSRLELRDMLMATCTLENSSSFSLDQGWTLCIQVLTSSSALDLDGAGSAFTYTIPVDRLGPGSRREVTLPLGPSESGMLDLPVTMSCWLYYSLKEVVGGALAPSDPLEVPYLEKLPLNLPKQEGVCLPLCKRTVDMLQCLRFPGVASQPTQAPCMPGSACEPVETFLKACQAPGIEPTGAASLRAKYLPPSTASIRVSAVLLRTALEDGHSGWWHYQLHFGLRALQPVEAGCSSLPVAPMSSTTS